MLSHVYRKYILCSPTMVGADVCSTLRQSFRCICSCFATSIVVRSASAVSPPCLSAPLTMPPAMRVAVAKAAPKAKAVGKAAPKAKAKTKSKGKGKGSSGNATPRAKSAARGGALAALNAAAKMRQFLLQEQEEAQKEDSNDSGSDTDEEVVKKTPAGKVLKRPAGAHDEKGRRDRSKTRAFERAIKNGEVSLLIILIRTPTIV